MARHFRGSDARAECDRPLYQQLVRPPHRRRVLPPEAQAGAEGWTEGSSLGQINHVTRTGTLGGNASEKAGSLGSENRQILRRHLVPTFSEAYATLEKGSARSK